LFDFLKNFRLAKVLRLERVEKCQ